MKKLFFLLITASLLFVSCGRKVYPDIPQSKEVQLSESNGYYRLDNKFIQSRGVTNAQLSNLDTYISEGILITAKEIPETTQKKNEFLIENGTAVDLEQIRINEKKYQEGYKESIQKGEEIQFIELRNNRYIFQSQSGVHIYTYPAGANGIFIIERVDNFVGNYDASKFRTTYILYRYEKRQKIVNEFDDSR